MLGVIRFPYKMLLPSLSFTGPNTEDDERMIELKDLHQVHGRLYRAL